MLSMPVLVCAEKPVMMKINMETVSSSCEVSVAGLFSPLACKPRPTSIINIRTGNGAIFHPLRDQNSFAPQRQKKKKKKKTNFSLPQGLAYPVEPTWLPI